MIRAMADQPRPTSRSRSPADALVLLVGAAGSGKSTLAGRLFPPDSILSSDALRAELSGDPANQASARSPSGSSMTGPAGGWRPGG